MEHSPETSVETETEFDFPELRQLPTFVALDFETSGNEADDACALGMVRVEQGRVLKPLFYTLIRPPRSTVLYTEIHGITWDMLKDKQGFAELWPQISAFMEGAEFLVAHNASFDRRVLLGCCESFGLPAPMKPFLCTVKAARRAWHRPHNDLASVSSFLGLPLDHHHAASDALACALVYLHAKMAGVEDRPLRTPSDPKSGRARGPRKKARF